MPFDLSFTVYGPRGGATARPQPQPYLPGYDPRRDWRPSPDCQRASDEWPVGHSAKGVIDCTYYNGQHIESVRVSARSYPELTPIRDAVFERLYREHGDKGIYVFFNNANRSEHSGAA